MKARVTTFLFLSSMVILLLAGCSGKNGATGAQGVAGQNGATGAQGVAGQNGIVISSLSATPNTLLPNRTATAIVNAYAPAGVTLNYTWAASNGWKVAGYGTTATITAPIAYNETGYITVTVDDGSASITGTTVLSTVSQLVTNTFSVGSKPEGIAIDASGNIWVANSGGKTVSKLSPAGTTVGTYTVGVAPQGVAIDRA